MIMENNVNNILIAPRYLRFVLLVYGNYIFLPAESSHSRQIHQHNTGIYPCYEKI